MVFAVAGLRHTGPCPVGLARHEKGFGGVMLHSLFNLVAETSSDARRKLLQAVTDLFFCDPEPTGLSKHHYGEIALRALPHLDPQARQGYADEVAAEPNLPRSVASKLEDPARKAEDAAVERAYARRTAQAWSQPFQPAAKVRAQSSAFGQPRTYVAGGPVGYHYGTDYLAPTGTPVTAVNNGTVVVAGMYPVRGGLVVIDHGAGVTSLYFHQRAVTVNVGQKVTRGQQVGEVGSTGLSTGAHLHLEMRVRGEGTDPAGWVNRLWPQ